MAVMRLLQFLDQNHAHYRTRRHRVAYSALASAKMAEVPKGEMVKTLLLSLDGSYTLAVLPSTKKLDFKKLKEITGSQNASLVREEELEGVFPDCTRGAIPPLGNLYHIPVISDKMIMNHQEIFFEPGSHREVMEIPTRDFLKLTHPRLADIHRR